MGYDVCTSMFLKKEKQPFVPKKYTKVPTVIMMDIFLPLFYLCIFPSKYFLPLQ